jgi:hypothetical protein
VLGLVSIIILFVQHQPRHPATARPPADLGRRCRTNNRSPPGPALLPASTARKGCAVAAQPRGKAAPTAPSYLRAAEVADILHVSPKTVSRWAKEGKLPFLKTLAATAATPEPRSASWPRDCARRRPPRRRGVVAGRRSYRAWPAIHGTDGATRHRTSLTKTGRPGLRHPSRRAAPWPRPASWIAAEPTAGWLAYAEAWPSTSTWTPR